MRLVRAVAIVVLSTAVYYVLLLAYNQWHLRVLVGPILGVPSLPLLYLPAIWIIAASIWFGVWGAAGLVFGLLIWVPMDKSGILAATVDALLPLTAGLLARAWRLDPALPDLRSYLLFARIVLLAAGAKAVAAALVTIVGLTRCPPDCLEPPRLMLRDIVSVSLPGLLLSPILLRVGTGWVRQLRLFYPRFFGFGVRP
jgi:hypothetical protein